MFASRIDAGKQLVARVQPFVVPQTLVLGIPRGGVVVASEIARGLKLPLDVLTVKKLSAPYMPELAIGALAPDHVSYIENRSALNTGADEAYINEEIDRVGKVLKHQEALFRKGKKPLLVKDRTIIIVDDGAATGATIEAAVKWLRKKDAYRIIAALPVVSAFIVKRIKPEVDELIVLEEPADLEAVGQFYSDFEQVEDAEVIQLLASSV